MAASAIASLPFIKCFINATLPFYSYNAVGTHSCARSASYAFILFLDLDIIIALGINPLGQRNNTLGAGFHTQKAALAGFFVKCYLSQINRPFA